MKEDSLYRKLIALRSSDILPMHMPGHKRALAEFPWLADLGAAFDITETEGFDDLYAPCGTLKDLLCRLASVWGSRRAFLSVNGSTGAMFAALSAVGEKGVIAARNCHRSVFNAIERLKLPSATVLPDIAEGMGFYGSVSPQAVAEALDATGYKAVVLTSPTYEGILSDVRAIADVAHERGALLILDAAHGAHLGLSDAFPKGGVREGADIVVMSLHKTLPSLTQTAVLHIATERADASDIASAIAAFDTSSPSYVFMAGVDGMAEYLEKRGRDKLTELASELAAFREKASSFKRLRLFDGMARDGRVFDIDSSKLYFDCLKCGFSGYELKKRLLSEFGIEVESAYPHGVLAYATVGDSCASLGRLFEACAAIDASGDAAENAESVSAPVFGERAEELFRAARLPSEKVSFQGAVGRVAAESVWVYPPGIPVLLPGERVTEGCVRYLAGAERRGAEVAAGGGQARGSVRVTAERDPKI